MFSKRALLLIGGSGDLGKAITTRFTQTRFKKWRVFNIDYEQNPQATHNFILEKEQSYSEKNIDSLHQQLKEFAEEYDAIINVAGYETEVKIGSRDVFEEYDKI